MSCGTWTSTERSHATPPLLRLSRTVWWPGPTRDGHAAAATHAAGRSSNEGSSSTSSGSGGSSGDGMRDLIGAVVGRLGI
jgi:hypothetical protein